MVSERILDNWNGVRRSIAEAAQRSGRSPEAVKLVAVTKKQPLETIRALAALGQTVLAENYPQELWSKVEALNDLNVEWHLIGHLQGNKVKKTAPLVKMIHAVDSLKLLQTLTQTDGDALPKLCLQVNTSREASKHGWSSDSILEDAEAIAGCERGRVVGLMTIAGYGTSAEEARPCFEALRTLRDKLASKTGLALPELSMGMSTDYISAVEEGATLVRIGSALFEGLEG